MEFRDILKNLPEVASPTEKKLSFNVKLKWTLIILVSFFVMSNVSLYDLAPQRIGFIKNTIIENRVRNKSKR